MKKQRIRMTEDFLFQTKHTKLLWSNIFKGLKGEKNQLQIKCPVEKITE